MNVSIYFRLGGVERPAPVSEVAGSTPGRVIPNTLKSGSNLFPSLAFAGLALRLTRSFQDRRISSTGKIQYPGNIRDITEQLLKVA